MTRQGRLDRLQAALGPAAACPGCGRARRGTLVFVPAEDDPTPADRVPCRGCGRPRVFVPDLGPADEDLF